MTYGLGVVLVLAAFYFWRKKNKKNKKNSQMTLGMLGQRHGRKDKRMNKKDITEEEKAELESEKKFKPEDIIVVNEASLFLYENEETPYGLITEVVEFVDDEEEPGKFPRYVIKNAIESHTELYENCFRAATEREKALYIFHGPCAPGDNDEYDEYKELNENVEMNDDTKSED